MMVPTSAGPRPPRAWIVALFTERLPTKVAALLLAFIVWAVVRGEEPTEVVLSARFVPVVEGAVEVTAMDPDSVEVVVAGPKRELLKLRSRPPIVRRRFDDETPRRFRVTIQPADVEFPLGVQATAREVRPRTVMITLQRPTTPATATGAPAPTTPPAPTKAP